MKKKPEIKYGIEIVKPWSSEMYDHNDVVSEEMKMNILDAWKKALTRLNANLTKIDYEGLNWDEDAFNDESNEISNPTLVKLQRGIMYSGYGDGYSIQDVNDEFERELEDMPNFQLHESYSYLAYEGLLPRTSFMLIGYEWQKFDYHIIGSQECTSPVLSLSFHNDKS